ncbi:MAG TPA: ABC transporter permease, partial [Steroidobacteraceae bacterium]|nr:ABC transporter permease [Steroidobacteraceae bacterium]
MRRLLNLLRGRRERLERDLEREFRYHLDRRVEELIAGGSSEPEARRRASVEFGGVPQVREEVRDTWIVRWLDALARDVHYAMRSLTRSWGFTLGIGSVLALTIGANLAIFSVVNTVLLQPLAYPDSERLVSIETLWTNTGRVDQNVSGPDFLDWQAHSEVFEKTAVFYGGDDFVTIVGDRAVFANPRYVSADFFTVFGQTASAGRLLTASDIPVNEDAQPTVAVVAHHWAVQHFGIARAAVGKSITVYGNRMEIVGVAAPEFRYPGAADLWAPWFTNSGGSRGLHNYQAVGKVKAGVGFAYAHAQMRTIGDTLSRQYPENRVKTVTLIPLQERLT